MIKFESYNANPKGKKTTDCVIRALTVALGRPYEEIYEEIFRLSLKCGYMLNDKKCIEKFLTLNGFVKYKQPRKLDNTKYQIGEIDKVSKEDIIVISCAGHLTVVKSGVLKDIWDCRYKCISNYYLKSE